MGVALDSIVLWGDDRRWSGLDVGNMILFCSEAPGVLASSFAVCPGRLVIAVLFEAKRKSFGVT